MNWGIGAFQPQLQYIYRYNKLMRMEFIVRSTSNGGHKHQQKITSGGQNRIRNMHTNVYRVYIFHISELYPKISDVDFTYCLSSYSGSLNLCSGVYNT